MGRTLKLQITAFVVLVVANLSCKDAGTAPTGTNGPPSAEVSFSQQIQPIFNGNGCVSCHGGSGGLSLTAGQSYNNLVNVNAQAGCTTKKRVLPGNPSESVLYIRISANTPDTECGPNSRMPQGSPRLPQATIDLVREWIAQGAKNN
ncbi:MAG TPA: hypothetical protein VNL36_08955 [Bacteroidota bacterium]|nr:hypothetical protein [Bacteroidota bacterium]